VNYGKTADSIEMPFGLVGRVGPGNRVLHGGPDTPTGRGKCARGMGRRSVTYRESATQPLPKLLWDFLLRLYDVVYSERLDMARIAFLFF